MNSMSTVWRILMFVWYALWALDFIATGTPDHGMLACGLACFALLRIEDGM